MPRIDSHRDLRVYQLARAAAAFVFQLTLRFPVEEKYGATSQSRNCSRSVCANIGEAWRKRKYPGAFISKLSDSEGEAAEMQIWFDLTLDCGYITKEEHAQGVEMYEVVIRGLVVMAKNSESFARINNAAK